MKSKKAWITVGIIAVIVGFFLLRPAEQKIVQVHNKKCPVSGSPVNGKDTYVHEGKEYNLCNKKCKEPLSQNPKKYLGD